MQRFIKTLILITVVTGVLACDGSRSAEVRAAPDEPRLQEFQVVDSYGSTQTPSYTPILDPTVNEGLFEVYWYAESFYDYWVTVTLNDRPSMAGSIILSEELCGYDFSCDYDGMQICAYDADFFMGCGADLYSAERNMVDIYDLIWDIPEYLYLNIEVCDETGWSCEVSSRPVTLY